MLKHVGIVHSLLSGGVGVESASHVLDVELKLQVRAMPVSRNKNRALDLVPGKEEMQMCREIVIREAKRFRDKAPVQNQELSGNIQNSNPMHDPPDARSVRRKDRQITIIPRTLHFPWCAHLCTRVKGGNVLHASCMVLDARTLAAKD